MSLFGFGKKKKENDDSVKNKKDPKEVGDATINCSMQMLHERLAKMTGNPDDKEADDEKEEKKEK